jgi:AraC family transcriptional regulator
MQIASKLRASAPVCSYVNNDYSIEYGRQSHVTLNERHPARSQLIVLPDADCEAEFYWREPGQTRRGIRLEGPHVVYIPSGVPYAMEWTCEAAWVRFSFAPEFIRQSAASIPQDKVCIRHEWKIAGAGLMVRQLFHEFCELCRHPVDATACPRYLEALGAFAARHIVSHLDEKSPGSTGLPLPQLGRVLGHIDGHFREKILTGTLARIAGLGQHHFTRLFKASTGMTSRRYIIMRRVECARRLLAEGGMGVAEIAEESGFYDQSHLDQSLKKYRKASIPVPNSADFIQKKPETSKTAKRIQGIMKP